MNPGAWIVDDEVTGEHGWPVRKHVFIATHDSACREWLARDRAHPGRPRLIDPSGLDRSTEARTRMAKFEAEKHATLIAQANKPLEGQP